MSRLPLQCYCCKITLNSIVFGSFTCAFIVTSDFSIACISFCVFVFFYFDMYYWLHVRRFQIILMKGISGIVRSNDIYCCIVHWNVKQSTLTIRLMYVLYAHYKILMTFLPNKAVLASFIFWILEITTGACISFVNFTMKLIFFFVSNHKQFQI